MRMSKADRTLIRAVEALKVLVASSPDPRTLAAWAMQYVAGAQRASPAMLSFFAGSIPVMIVEPPKRTRKDKGKGKGKGKGRGGRRS